MGQRRWASTNRATYPCSIPPDELDSSASAADRALQAMPDKPITSGGRRTRSATPANWGGQQVLRRIKTTAQSEPHDAKPQAPQINSHRRTIRQGSPSMPDRCCRASQSRHEGILVIAVAAGGAPLPSPGQPAQQHQLPVAAQHGAEHAQADSLGRRRSAGSHPSGRGATRRRP